MNTVRLSISKNTFTKSPNFMHLPWIGYELGGKMSRQYLPDRKYTGEWPPIKVGDSVELEVVHVAPTFTYVRPISNGSTPVVSTKAVELSTLEERYGTYKIPHRRRAIPLKAMKVFKKEKEATDTLLQAIKDTVDYWSVLANNIVVDAFESNREDEKDMAAVQKDYAAMKMVGAHPDLLKQMRDAVSKAGNIIDANDGGKKAIIKMTEELVARKAVEADLKTVYESWGLIEKTGELVRKSPIMLLFLAKIQGSEEAEAKALVTFNNAVDKFVHDAIPASHS